MRRGFLIAGACLLLSGAGFALAQEAEENGLDNETKTLVSIGFQQFQEVSRVFVRTSDPVKYRINNKDKKSVTLILENTQVTLENNKRAMDTSFFDSPVRYIQPEVIEGPSQSVHIVIYLQSKVPYEEVQQDTLLALDFQR